MVIRTLIFLSRELKEQFDRLTKNKVRNRFTQDRNTIVIELIGKYLRGEIEKEKIKGQNQPAEIPVSVYIRGPRAVPFWEEFNLKCQRESKEPSRVIVDLINLYVRGKLKQLNNQRKERRRPDSHQRVKVLQDENT
jgi:hypothetical protein